MAALRADAGGRLLHRCQQNPVSLVPEILKVLDADDVGGFPSPTKQLQGTLILVTNWKQVKTPAVIYSRASVSSEGNERNRAWRQEGGRERCHPGVPDLVLTTMTSISCSTHFYNRDETFFFFFKSIPNNKDPVKRKGVCLELVHTVGSAKCQGATEASFLGVRWLPASPSTPTPTHPPSPSISSNSVALAYPSTGSWYCLWHQPRFKW